jgi:hypothetical protein
MVATASARHKAGDDIKNTATYEASVAARVLVEQLRQLERSGADVALEGPSESSLAVGLALGAAGAVPVGAKAHCGSVLLGAGDVIFWQRESFVVRSCAMPPGGLFLLAERLERVAFKGDHSVMRVKVQSKLHGEWRAPQPQTRQRERRPTPSDVRPLPPPSPPLPACQPPQLAPA